MGAMAIPFFSEKRFLLIRFLMSFHCIQIDANRIEIKDVS